MKFEIVGDRDPFLLVDLNQGEQVYAESGAMASMDSSLDLVGEIRGGVLGSLARKFVAGESLFTQKVQAARGPGQVLFSPLAPGDIQLLDITPERSYLLNDGAFLAAETDVELKMRFQGIGKALLGGTGGFFIVEAKGRGVLAVAGFGSVFGLEVKGGNDLIIDNQHVVAWDSALSYSIGIKTAESKGFFGNAVNAATSGEGIITRFSGNGKVYLSSRSLTAFARTITTVSADNVSQQQNLQQSAQNITQNSAMPDLGTIGNLLRGRL